ncbi:MAG: group 1 truncated hemoglobin [Pseudomonadota bacterium]
MKKVCVISGKLAFIKVGLSKIGLGNMELNNKALGRLIRTLALPVFLQVAPHQAVAATLYEDLGGDEGVAGVVDQFLWNLADDERVNEYFVETNLDRFRSKLIEYICQVAQGPCAYTGDDMARTHANMNVTESAFNVTVESLILAMETRNIPTGVQNRLLKALAVSYSDVVEE